MGKITKLISRDFFVKTEDLADPSRRLELGDSYSYFVDPETGRFYEPVDGYSVVAAGETDLSDLFREVIPREYSDGD